MWRKALTLQSGITTHCRQAGLRKDTILLWLSTSHVRRSCWQARKSARSFVQTRQSGRRISFFFTVTFTCRWRRGLPASGRSVSSLPAERHNAKASLRVKTLRGQFRKKDSGRRAAHSEKKIQRNQEAGRETETAWPRCCFLLLFYPHGL